MTNRISKYLELPADEVAGVVDERDINRLVTIGEERGYAKGLAVGQSRSFWFCLTLAGLLVAMAFLRGQM